MQAVADVFGGTVTWEQTIQWATLAVAGGTAVLAGLTAIAVNASQARAARAAWRRELLAQHYLSLNEAVKALMHFVLAEYAGHYSGSPSAGEAVAPALYKEARDRVASEARAVSVVGQYWTLKSLNFALNRLPSEQLLMYGRTKLMHPTWLRSAVAASYMSELFKPLERAMRIDLQLGPWWRRLADRWMLVRSWKLEPFPPAIPSPLVPLSLEDGTFFLASRGLERLDRGPIDEISRFLAAPEIIESVGTDNNILQGAEVVAILMLFLEHQPAFAVTSAVSSEQERAILTELAFLQDRNFRAILGPWRDGPDGAMIFAWTLDSDGNPKFV